MTRHPYEPQLLAPHSTPTSHSAAPNGSKRYPHVRCGRRRDRPHYQQDTDIWTTRRFHRFHQYNTLTSGTYKPTNFDNVEQDFFPPPAPAGLVWHNSIHFQWDKILTEPGACIWWMTLVTIPLIILAQTYTFRRLRDITITASPQSLPVNPIDEAQFFIRSTALITIFNRHADDLGLAFWDELTSSLAAFDSQCIEDLKRINTSVAFFLSIEFQQTWYLVYRIYKAAYGYVPGTPVPLTRQEFVPDDRRAGRASW